MNELSLIFPNQLYNDHPALKPDCPVYLIEDSLFFHDPEYPIRFHKQKLILHRASMKAYQKKLELLQYKVKYIEFKKNQTFIQQMSYQIPAKVTRLHLCDPTDYILRKRVERFAQLKKLKIEWYENPNFLSSQSESQNLLGTKHPFRFSSFYAAQRKRLKILVNQEGKPYGGRWSYDPLNRKKLPKKVFVPPFVHECNQPETTEARNYIEQNFKDHPGNSETFLFPITSLEAETWFNLFLEDRFFHFGPYEDAISKDHLLLFHSGISSSLNIGLLSPDEIVHKTLIFFKEHREIPIESLEGFIRQVIGWREYIRAVYEVKGVQQRNSNYWDHHRKIPISFWKGMTGIEPIDHTIHKVVNHAYTHHIERLMILGNFMMLCEFDPDDVYRWFMTFYIDSYDWVMVPNVYGMSQHSDGGLIVTKPYISSSNYILKMSDYKKGSWCDVWDGLYWRFIQKNQAFFTSNPRLHMMVKLLDKMDESKKKHLLQTAEQFLKTL